MGKGVIPTLLQQDGRATIVAYGPRHHCWLAAAPCWRTLGPLLLLLLLLLPLLLLDLGLLDDLGPGMVLATFVC